MSLNKLIIRVLTPVFIISIPLFQYRLITPIGNLSIDRLLVGLIAIISVISFFTNIRNSVKEFTILLVVLTFYLFFNKIVYIESIESKFAMFIISILTIYVVYNTVNKGYDLDKFILISFYIFVVLNLYSLSGILINGQLITELPLAKYIPYIATSEFQHVKDVNMSYLFPRNSLPFATPPHLSITLAVYSIFFLYKFYQSNKTSYILLMAISVIINLTTISRSGILAFILGGIIFLLFYDKKEFSFKIIFYLLVILIFSSFFFYVTDTEFEKILFQRLSIDSSTSGHLEGRLIAVNLFMEHGLLEKFIGVGIGNYPGLHSHMTPLTLLIEIGIIGVLLYYLAILYPIKHIFRKKKIANHTLIRAFCFSMLSTIFVGQLLYEFTFVTPTYLFIGYVAGVTRKIKNE